MSQHRTLHQRHLQIKHRVSTDSLVSRRLLVSETRQNSSATSYWRLSS